MLQPKYHNIINEMDRCLARNPASLTKTPTFHGAFAANGLKRAHLIQFRRAMWPAHLTHGGSFDRLVRGVFNVCGADAPMKV